MRSVNGCPAIRSPIYCSYQTPQPITKYSFTANNMALRLTTLATRPLSAVAARSVPPGTRSLSAFRPSSVLPKSLPRSLPSSHAFHSSAARNEAHHTTVNTSKGVSELEIFSTIMWFGALLIGGTVFWAKYIGDQVENGKKDVMRCVDSNKVSCSQGRDIDGWSTCKRKRV